MLANDSDGLEAEDPVVPLQEMRTTAKTESTATKTHDQRVPDLKISSTSLSESWAWPLFLCLTSAGTPQGWINVLVPGLASPARDLASERPNGVVKADHLPDQRVRTVAAARLP